MQCLIDIQILARYSPILLVGLLCFWLHQGDNSHHFLHVPHYLSLFKISFFLKNWTCTCTLSSPRAHNCLSIGGDVPQTISLHGDGFQLQTALSCSSVQLLRTTAVQFGKQGEAAVRTCTCFCTGLDLSSCSLEETRGHHKDQKESSSCLLPQVFRRRRLFPFNFLCTFGLDLPLLPNDKICKRTFKTKGQHKRGTPKDQRKRHSCRWINN